MKFKFLILLIFLLFLTGCGTDNDRITVPVSFYYIQNEVDFGTTAVIIKETTREASGHAEDYDYLISQYLNGPISYDCVSPFPAGTTLKELHWDQNRVQIVLSPEITTLSGVDLILACGCLTKTVSQMIGVDTVQIRSSSGLINGEKIMTFHADDFLYLDQSTPAHPAN